MSVTPPDRAQLDGAPLPEERRFEEQLRPRTLDEMVGQDRLRENLGVFIRAARGRGHDRFGHEPRRPRRLPTWPAGRDPARCHPP